MQTAEPTSSVNSGPHIETLASSVLLSEALASNEFLPEVQSGLSGKSAQNTVESDPVKGYIGFADSFPPPTLSSSPL